jgi:hypothetical protein
MNTLDVITKYRAGGSKVLNGLLLYVLNILFWVSCGISALIGCDPRLTIGMTIGIRKDKHRLAGLLYKLAPKHFDQQIANHRGENSWNVIERSLWA